MTTLRQRMTDDLRLRNRSLRTPPPAIEYSPQRTPLGMHSSVMSGLILWRQMKAINLESVLLTKQLVCQYWEPLEKNAGFVWRGESVEICRHVSSFIDAYRCRWARAQICRRLN